MAETQTWDVSNLKAVRVNLNRFGNGQVWVNGVDITEKITDFTMDSVVGSHVTLTVTLVQPPATEEKPEIVVEETEVAPPEIPGPDASIEPPAPLIVTEGGNPDEVPS